MIVDAVANFHQQGRNVEAMIVGDGEIRQELKESPSVSASSTKSIS